MFGAHIGGFEAYFVLVSHCGGYLEQNIVGVILVVQNFFEIFCIDFVSLSGSPCILKVNKTRTE